MTLPKFRFSIPVLVLLAVLLYRAPSPTSSGLIDTDYYWHIAYGEWILDHLRLPTVDFWSWTFDGHGYRLTQWASEALMALAQRVTGGEVGTQILSASLVTLTLTFSYLAARAYLPNRLAALAIAVGCDAILVPLTCRPHQFTHLGLAILTALMAHHQVRGDRRLLFAVPVVLAIWVNLHGGYAVGLAYLWMLAGAAGIQTYITHDHAALRSQALPLAVVALGATAATLLNPYGIGAWQYVIDIASLKSSSAGIVDEWNPTTIKSDVGLNWFMVSTATLAAMTTARSRPTARDLICTVALLAAGWSALRVSLMMAVLLVPFLAAAFRETPLYTLGFDGQARRYDRDVAFGPAVGILAVMLAVSLLLGRADKTAANYVREHFPEREVTFIKANHIEGRLLNNPESGGYLIRNLGAKVFIDTRLDLYGDRHLFEFLFARRGMPGWQGFIAHIDPDVLLLDNICALRQLLLDTGRYRAVFEGPRYTVLVRPNAYPALPSVVPAPSTTTLLDQLATP